MLEDRKRLKQETGSTQCKWSGRRLIEFAVHGSKPFVDQLRGLSIDMDSAGLKALEKLRQLGRHVDVSNILNGFATAKNVLESRFTQYTSFLHKPPWSFVALLEYLLPSTSMAETTKRSRVLTGKLLRLHDLNQIGNLGDVGREFFAKHRTALSRWAKGHDHFMQQQLFRQLVAWASSLLVMKRLEAKHHLVHVTQLGWVELFWSVVSALITRQHVLFCLFDFLFPSSCSQEPNIKSIKSQNR